MKKLLLTFVAFTALATPTFAEHFDVEMNNRGEKGSMVFEPDFMHIQPGDSVKFLAKNKSHNAATIEGMLPEGHPGFKGKINEEIEVTFDQEGIYGIKCSPHYGMGMVMMIKVGEASLPDSYREVEVPKRSQERMKALFEQVSEAAE